MRFAPTDEQHGFAQSLDDLLAAADTHTVVRAWAEGDPEPGLKLWQRLADLGVSALLVPAGHGGLGATPVDLVVAFEALGRFAVPGPWVESVAYLPTAAADAGLLQRLAAGAVATVAVPPHTPRALDADVTSEVYVVSGASLSHGTAGSAHRSLDPARRLFDVRAGDALGEVDASRAFDLAALASSAQLLGLGERLLALAVEHAKTRRQFGREVGSFQAVKHALADVRIGLDFARPLVHGAALAVGTATASRDVSAAKVAAGDAAYRAARTALQVHGAIGYTAEHDLGLWLLKTRALVGAWGTPGVHRARVLTALTVDVGR
jgi:alkylation response protein AidB-like acyl-CoA dehydrogenase